MNYNAILAHFLLIFLFFMLEIIRNKCYIFWYAKSEIEQK